jgi:hypothetical protein
MSQIIELTIRLGQLLAQEVMHLRAMEISAVEKLQKEKARLTAALEKIEREVTQAPPSFTREEKEEYLSVHSAFQEILKENQRHLFVAREINAQIVGVIRESRLNEESTPVYTQKGERERHHHAVHMALNDII